MDAGVFSFSKLQIDHGFLDQVWAFSPNKLGSLTNEMVSQYSIALAQYLIYFKWEQNKARAEITKKKRLLESAISISVDEKLQKKYKTKAALTEYMINTSPELNKLSEEIDTLQMELTKTDGIDKVINEYIATFKKELSRREQELFATRAERR
jgi:hypothetical protein